MKKYTDTIFWSLFGLLLLYGTYIESMKQYELYQYNSELLNRGTITKADGFYRTGMDGDVLGFDFYNEMSKKMEHGATWDTGNVGEIIKYESIDIIYMKEADHYRSKYYDQVIKELKPWHIILHSLFYVVLFLSVIVPLLILQWIHHKRQLSILRRIVDENDARDHS